MLIWNEDKASWDTAQRFPPKLYFEVRFSSQWLSLKEDWFWKSWICDKGQDRLACVTTGNISSAVCKEVRECKTGILWFFLLG